MKKLFSLAAVAALSVGQMATAHAVDFTVAVGQTDESTMTYRLGAQFDFNRSWFQTSVGRLTGYWDAGYTYWEGDESSSNHSISLAPVFVYEFAGESVKPYVEAGIGVAAFENTEVEGNRLGSSSRTGSALACVSRAATKSECVRSTTPMPASRSRTMGSKATPCIIGWRSKRDRFSTAGLSPALL